MAVTLRSTPTTDGSFATTGSIAKPTGLVVGDLLLWFVANQPDSTGTTTITTPTGFTKIDEVEADNGVTNSRQVRLAAFYRTVDGTEGSTFSATGTSAGNPVSITGIMIPLTGVDPTTPITLTSGVGYSKQSGNATGTTITANGISGAQAGGLLIGHQSTWETDRGPLSGFTDIANLGGNGAEACSLAIVSSGATGNQTCSCSSTECWTSFLIAINPGAASTVVAPSGSRSSARAGAPQTFPTTAPAGSRTAMRSGATQDFAAVTVAPSGSRSAARSGALVLFSTIQPAGSRIASRSGASQDIAAIVSVSPSGSRDQARSGALVLISTTAPAGSPSELSGAISDVATPQLTGSRSAERSGASQNFPTTAPSGSRPVSSSGASLAAALLAVSGSKHGGRSGASIESVAITIAPSGSRDQARSGALTVLAFLAPSGSRDQARSGAVSEASIVTLSGSRDQAHSGAITESSAVTVAPSGSRDQARSGASTAVATAAPSGTRSAARSGASVELSGVIIAPSGSRDQARSGASQALPTTAPSGSRARTHGGAATNAATTLPAGSRSTASSGSSSESTAITCSPSGSRDQARSGASTTFALVACSGSRDRARSGACTDLPPGALTTAGSARVTYYASPIEVSYSRSTMILGSAVRLFCTFKDFNNEVADPDAVTLQVEIVGQPPTSLQPVRDDVGKYHFDYTPAAPGRYRARWQGTGAIQAAGEHVFVVSPSQI